MVYLYAMVNGDKVIAEERRQDAHHYYVAEPFIIDRCRGNQNILLVEQYPAFVSSFGEVELYKLNVAQRFIPSTDEIMTYHDAKNGNLKKQLNG